MRLMLNAVTIVTVLLLMFWITLIFDIGNATMYAYRIITELLG